MSDLRAQVDKIRKIVREEAKIKYTGVRIIFLEDDSPPLVSGRKATKRNYSTRRISCGMYWSKLRDMTIGNPALTQYLCPWTKKAPEAHEIP